MTTVPVPEGHLPLPSSTLSAQGHEQPLPEVAKQFEALLLRQLIKAMRTTSPVFESDSGSQYMAMADEALADHLATAGGIGLTHPLMQGLQGEDDQESLLPLSRPSTGIAARVQALRLYARNTRPAHTGAQTGAAFSSSRVTSAGPRAGAPLQGAGGTLQRIAGEVLAAEPERWSKAGRLTWSELQSDFASRSAAGAAHFNVQDAAGYEGHPKCNLFAFEVARRGGFHVPLVPREAGWGFPAAETVTRQAAAGQLDWGRSVTGAAAGAVQSQIEAGNHGFLLAGEGTGGKPGHMAVIERVRAMDYDATGKLRRIEFDGWEARTSGAQYLRGRVWKLGGGSGRLTRSGFGRIEVIQLQHSRPGERPERPQAAAAAPSIHDSFSSSSQSNRPTTRVEDES